MSLIAFIVVVRQKYKRLEDDWVAVINQNEVLSAEYQYKVNRNRTSWNSSRTTCQNWGGDLAVYGIQDFESRKYD